MTLDYLGLSSRGFLAFTLWLWRAVLGIVMPRTRDLFVLAACGASPYRARDSLVGYHSSSSKAMR